MVGDDGEVKVVVVVVGKVTPPLVAKVVDTTVAEAAKATAATVVAVVEMAVWCQWSSGEMYCTWWQPYPWWHHWW